MKLLLSFIFLFQITSAFSSFKFVCHRADGGESPIITYSSHRDYMIVLNDGSGIGWGDEGIDVKADFRDETKIRLDGLVSGTLSLEEKTQNVEFKFDIRRYGSYLKNWFNEQGDFLADKRTSLSTVKGKFNCRNIFL